MKKFLTVLLVLVVAMGFVFAADYDGSTVESNTTSVTYGATASTQTSDTLKLTTTINEKTRVGFIETATIPQSFDYTTNTSGWTSNRTIAASALDSMSVYYQTNSASASIGIKLQGGAFIAEGISTEMGYSVNVGNSTLTVEKGDTYNGTAGTHNVVELYDQTTQLTKSKADAFAFSDFAMNKVDANAALASTAYIATLAVTISTT